MPETTATDQPQGGLVTHRQPQRARRGMIVRSDGEQVEILIVGVEGMDLDHHMDGLRGELARFARVAGRGVECWPVGHPDMPNGLLVSGVDISEIPRVLGGLDAVAWSRGGDGTILEGRW